MEYELRTLLASNFAELIRTIREEKWEPFSQAAEEDGMEPYVALSGRRPLPGRGAWAVW